MNLRKMNPASAFACLAGAVLTWIEVYFSYYLDELVYNLHGSMQLFQYLTAAALAFSVLLTVFLVKKLHSEIAVILLPLSFGGTLCFLSAFCLVGYYSLLWLAGGVVAAVLFIGFCFLVIHIKARNNREPKEKGLDDLDRGDFGIAAEFFPPVAIITCFIAAVLLCGHYGMYDDLTGRLNRCEIISAYAMERSDSDYLESLGNAAWQGLGESDKQAVLQKLVNSESGRLKLPSAPTVILQVLSENQEAYADIASGTIILDRSKVLGMKSAEKAVEMTAHLLFNYCELLEMNVMDALRQSPEYGDCVELPAFRTVNWYSSGISDDNGNDPASLQFSDFSLATRHAKNYARQVVHEMRRRHSEGKAFPNRELLW